MRNRAILIVLILSLSGAAFAAGSKPPLTDGERVTKLADEYVAEYLLRFPDNALLSGMEPPKLDHLSSNSQKAIAAWQRLEDGWWKALGEIDADGLFGKQEWITYGFLREALETSRGLRVCRNEIWHVSQLDGWQVMIPMIAAAAPVDTPVQRSGLLRMFGSLPEYARTEIANLETGLAAGYSSPRHNVELVITQLDGLIDVPIVKSPLRSPADRAHDAAFQKKWDALLSHSVVPALRSYRKYLHEKYLPRARTSIGVSALPNGVACYAASLRSYTGLTVTPQEMFDNGKRAVAEREKLARELAEKIYGSPDLTALREKLEKDVSNHFQTANRCSPIHRLQWTGPWRLCQGTSACFPAARCASCPFRPLMKSTYSQLCTGNGRRSAHGVYNISLYQPEKQNRSGLESTAFHETVPGHHLQISIAQRRPQAHPITRLLWNSGYGEGWAVYAEGVADEMGLYSSDLSRLGEYIQLPTGMVADPGIHVMGWTRQQTIDYFLATRADYSPERAESQADRIAVSPDSSPPISRARSRFAPSAKWRKRIWATASTCGSFMTGCSKMGPSRFRCSARKLNAGSSKPARSSV